MGKWNELADEVKESVINEFPEILNDRYYQDRLAEIVDSAVPVYYGELIDVLADNHNLASVDDTGLLPDNPTVYDIISTAIYEQLSMVANETYDEECDNWVECEECGEWKDADECGKNEYLYDKCLCDECVEKLSVCESCGRQFDFEKKCMGERYCNKCAEEYAEE